MGYCSRCHGQNGYLANDLKLCHKCEESEEKGDELTKKTNKLLNEYALTRKDSTLIKALQTENQRLKINTH